MASFQLTQLLLSLRVFFIECLAAVELLVKHSDQHRVSFLSISCYQGAFKQTAEHIQDLNSKDSHDTDNVTTLIRLV